MTKAGPSAVEIAKQRDQKEQEGEEGQEEIVGQLRRASEDFIFFRPGPNAPEKLFGYQAAGHECMGAAISPSFRCGSSETA